MFRSNQREAFLIERFYWPLYLFESKLFNSLVKIKFEIKSRLSCIDIIAYLTTVVLKVKFSNVFQVTLNLKRHMPDSRG